MSDESPIFFHGPGPDQLPIAQGATATGHTNTGVTMTVYALVSSADAPAADPQTRVAPMSVHMTSQLAREADHILSTRRE